MKKLMETILSLYKQLEEKKLDSGKKIEIEKWKMAVVQTAYANGSSTNFFTNELKFQVKIVPTGVKFLYSEAIKNEIGIIYNLSLNAC